MANFLMDKADALLVWQETKARWKANTPKYFRTTRMIYALLVLAAATPEVLALIRLIPLPEWANVVLRILIGMGAGGFVQSNLVVTAKDVNKTDLPYTEKKQVEQIIKNEADNFKPPTGN